MPNDVTWYRLEMRPDGTVDVRNERTGEQRTAPTPAEAVEQLNAKKGGLTT